MLDNFKTKWYNFKCRKEFKMLAKKILTNLVNGNYRLEYREHCDCTFDWSIENGKLVCDTDVYDCWIETVWLIMDDLAGQRDGTLGVLSSGIIASYDACCGLTMLLRKASIDAEQEIVNAIKESDTYTQLIADIYSPNPKNDLHNRRKRESLVKWLEKEKKKGV